MKRLKDSSDAPEARHGILLKQIQTHRKGQDQILLALGRMGIARYINKGAGRKRVCS